MRYRSLSFVVSVSLNGKANIMSEQSDTTAQNLIEQEAAVWLARRASGEMSAEEHARFQTWRQQSPAHRQAERKLQRLWQLLPAALADSTPQTGFRPEREFPVQPDAVRLPDDSGSEPAKTQHPPDVKTSGPNRKPVTARTGPGTAARACRRSAGLAMAASLLWAVCMGYCSNYLRHPWADYRTLVGEQRVVRLDDGSTVYLNTDTALDFALTAGERRIVLLRGEAEFDVAHDSRRPFRVAAGHTTTEAIGTRFVVRYTGSVGRVTLLEGRVRTRQTGSANATAGPIELNPGEQAVFDEAGLDRAQAVDTSAAEAWRRQRLVMNFATLQEVVTEINRYRPGHVWVLDNALAQRQVHVSVDIQHIDDWLNTLPNVLPLRIIRFRPGHQVLLQRAGR